MLRRSLAQHLDHGIHHLAFPFSLRIRLLRCSCGVRTTSHLASWSIVEPLTMYSWRWSYGVASIYGAIVLSLIILFMEETYASVSFFALLIPHAPFDSIAEYTTAICQILNLSRSPPTPSWGVCNFSLEWQVPRWPSIAQAGLRLSWHASTSYGDLSSSAYSCSKQWSSDSVLESM